MKRKVVNNLGTWADLIPKVIWAYRTTIKIGSGYPPFTLAFGIDIVAPKELIWHGYATMTRGGNDATILLNMKKWKKKGREH